MKPFTYVRPRSVASALESLAASPHAEPLAGGTCLVDLMRQGVQTPETVVDLTFLAELNGISLTASGALRVAAATSLADVAGNATVRARWPLLHEAIVDGLTPQLRNAATFGGNIMQRPRCIYFRETAFDCNKKRPGSGCAALAGVHYAHAVFGGSEAEKCIAVHPSDLCVALTALDATVRIAQTGGIERAIPLAELHRLPGNDPTRETTLREGELITAIEIPPEMSRAGAYVKGSEGFTLASCAALLDVRTGIIGASRVVLGGVAHKPWRALPAEAALRGRLATGEVFERAADEALTEAATDEQTAFRRQLVRGAMLEALETAAARGGYRP